MHKGRLEAFSDGVIAIIITIMVLELKVPHGVDLADLSHLLPVFLSYVLSFIYVGIYWNNHHHMMQIAKSIDGLVMWSNLHLLFWLSLIPFATGWMGENHYAVIPVAVYGFALLMCAIAFYIFSRCLVRHHGKESDIASAVGSDRKAMLSVILYAAGICLTIVEPEYGILMYVIVALIWFIPDRRIEKKINP